MKVLIVGLSGIGEILLQLLIRTFQERLKKVALIDPDTWEKNQSYKTVLSAHHQIGSAKVSICKAQVKQLYPNLDVYAIKKRVQEIDPKCFEEFEVVISCVDNDETRVYLQLLCAENEKILLDLSAQITKEGRMATIRLYIPNKTPCLFCQGLKPEALMTETLKAAKKSTGYLDPDAEQDLGSVALLDTAAACIGITHLELHLTNSPKKMPSTLSFHQENHEIKQLYFKSNDHCFICGKEKILCQESCKDQEDTIAEDSKLNKVSAERNSS